MLNFTPKWGIAQGVEQVIDAVRSGRVRNYHDAIHSNVIFLANDVSMHPENGWANELIESQRLASAVIFEKAVTLKPAHEKRRAATGR
jgi:hypothetical protein